MDSSAFHRDEEGMTLVELLVVFVVLGIIGTIVLSGIVTSLRTTTRAQDRIDALTDLEKGMERIGRELRAACQIVTFAPDDATVNVIRGTDVHRYRYVLGSVLGESSEPNSLYEVHSVFDPSTDDFVTQSTRLFIRDLQDLSPFVYLDPGGDPTTVPTDVAMTEITLRRDLPRQDPIEVHTGVHLRNHGGFTCDT